MCGIAGFISPSFPENAAYLLKQMTDAIAHRGPDGESFFTSTSGNANFGHRRLSVLDPTSNALQPMQYLNRYTILHNGEVYNYKEIRNELEKKGCIFKSHSDTEVIVAAFHEYREQCLQLFDGMFAFVIWDEVSKSLFLSRDRFGEKPLFFHIEAQQNRFVFASEIKALWAYGIPKLIDHRLLLQFLTLGYQNELENKRTFYANILQIPAGHYATVSAAQPTEVTLTAYWDIDKEKCIKPSVEKTTERLLELLEHSITKRLRSNVPIGATLSGGLDSSSIVAITTARRKMHLPCFSAIFREYKNELPFIETLSNLYGLKNFVVSPTADDFIHDFERLLYHQEQPISSASVFAQFKVFELAKQHGVVVLLEGQGADEILAGYSKYIPVALRELNTPSTAAAYRMERHAWSEAGIQFDYKQKIAATFPSATAQYLAIREKNKLHNRDLTVAYKRAYGTQELYKPVIEKLNDILYYNTRQNGLPELLRYADRNAMAHGREARLPFLNHELAEFIFSLPVNYKIHQGWTKWILRKAVEPLLPPMITWRKEKVAFEPPQRQWMQSTLIQEYIRNARQKLVDEKIMNQKILHKKIQPHDAYAADNSDWRYLVAGSLLK